MLLSLTRSFDAGERRRLGYQAPMCAAFVKKWLEMIVRRAHADPRLLDPTEVKRAQQAYANRPRGGDSKRAFWVSMAGLNVRWNANRTFTPNQVIGAIAKLRHHQGLVIRITHTGPVGEAGNRPPEMHAMAVYNHPTAGLLFFNPGHAVFVGSPPDRQKIIGIDIWYYISHRYKILYRSGIRLTEVERLGR